MQEMVDERFLKYIGSLGTLEEICEDRKGRFSKDSKITTQSKAQKFVDFTEAVQEIQFSRTRQPYAFITVNPKPEIDFEDFNDQITKCVDRYFDWCLYTYEIRNAPSQGLHCHLIGKIKDKYQNGNFSRIKDMFVPAYCGNTLHVLIKYVVYQDLEKVSSYVLKPTVSKSKQKSHLATLAWRDENYYPPFYQSGDVPTCLVPPEPEQIEAPPEVD